MPHVVVLEILCIFWRYKSNPMVLRFRCSFKNLKRQIKEHSTHSCIFFYLKHTHCCSFPLDIYKTVLIKAKIVCLWFWLYCYHTSLVKIHDQECTHFLCETGMVKVSWKVLLEEGKLLTVSTDIVRVTDRRERRQKIMPYHNIGQKLTIWAV